LLRVFRRVLLTFTAVSTLAFMLALGTTAALARPLPNCTGAPGPCRPIRLDYCSGGTWGCAPVQLGDTCAGSQIACAQVHWLSHRRLGARYGLSIFGLQVSFSHPRPLDQCAGSAAPCMHIRHWLDIGGGPPLPRLPAFLVAFVAHALAHPVPLGRCPPGSGPCP
jgi:hypothetical protein